MIFSKTHHIQAAGKIENVFIKTNQVFGEIQFFYDVVLIIDGVKYSISTSRISMISSGDDVKFAFVSDGNDNKIVSLVNFSNGSFIESSMADFYQLGIYLLTTFLILFVVSWPQIEIAAAFASFSVVSGYLVSIGWRVKRLSKLLAGQKS